MEQVLPRVFVRNNGAKNVVNLRCFIETIPSYIKTDHAILAVFLNKTTAFLTLCYRKIGWQIICKTSSEKRKNNEYEL